MTRLGRVLLGLALLLTGAALAEPSSRDVRIPFSRDGRGPRLLTRVWVPEGAGPFPAIILNHGAPRNAADRATRPDYPVAARWFAERGFVVAVPTRRGYGPEGGAFAETFGSCDRPNYLKAGRETARDISAVLRWLRAQAYVDRDAILAAGQSAGGFGVLALASRPPRGLRGVLNFAGGRGSPGPRKNCSEAALIDAVEALARTATVPSLWVYSRNDTFFWPQFARRLFRTWSRVAPARATFIELPPYAADGHRVFGSRDGPSLWGPVVADFLRTLDFKISAGPDALEWRQDRPEWAEPPPGVPLE